MAEKETKPDLDLLEDLQDDDITLSTSELEDIIHSTELSGESDSTEEQLEKYGVWVKVKPEPVTGGEPEDTAFELTDLERDQDLDLSPREEQLLSELEGELAGKESGKESGEESAAEEQALEPLEDLEVAELEAAAESPQARDTGAEGQEGEESFLEDLPVLEEESLEGLPGGLEPVDEEMDLELPEPSVLEEPAPQEEPEEQARGSREIEVPLSEKEEQSFDDLAALEEDLRTGEPAAPAALDSTGILQRIERELEAIKREIFDLKRELSGISKSPEAVPELPVEPTPDEAAGFFDEEEDETIALTGDELDNILNTADITEETSGAIGTAEEQAVEAQLGEESLAGESLAEGGPAGADLPGQPPQALIDQEDLIDLESEPGSLEALPPEALPGEQAEAAPAEEVPPAEPAEVEQAPSSDAGEAEGFLEEILLEEPVPPAEEEPALQPLEVEVVRDAGETAAAPIPAVEDVAAEDLSVEDLAANLLALEEEPPVELEAEEPAAPGRAVEPAAAELQPGGEVELPAEEELILEEEPLEEAPAGQAGEEAPAAEPADELEELEGIEIEAEEGEQAARQPPAGEAPPAGEEAGKADIGAVENEPYGQAEPSSRREAADDLPSELRSDIKSVLKYLDQLLEALPDEKIREFASSEYFDTYKRLFEELGLAD